MKKETNPTTISKYSRSSTWTIPEASPRTKSLKFFTLAKLTSMSRKQKISSTKSMQTVVAKSRRMNSSPSFRGRIWTTSTQMRR